MDEITQRYVVSVSDRCIGTKVDTVGPAYHVGGFCSLILHRPTNGGLRGIANHEIFIEGKCRDGQLGTRIDRTTGGGQFE
jgi:hypothetical protein